MLANVLPTLAGGVPMISEAIDCPFGEGDIGSPLAAIQKANPETSIGSYPRFTDTGFSTQLVVRGRDRARVNAAADAIHSMIATLKR